MPLAELFTPEYAVAGGCVAAAEAAAAAVVPSCWLSLPQAQRLAHSLERLAPPRAAASGFGESCGGAASEADEAAAALRDLLQHHRSLVATLLALARRVEPVASFGALEPRPSCATSSTGEDGAWGCDELGIVALPLLAAFHRAHGVVDCARPRGQAVALAAALFVAWKFLSRDANIHALLDSTQLAHAATVRPHDVLAAELRVLRAARFRVGPPWWWPPACDLALAASAMRPSRSPAVAANARRLALRLVAIAAERVLVLCPAAVAVAEPLLPMALPVVAGIVSEATLVAITGCDHAALRAAVALIQSHLSAQPR